MTTTLTPEVLKDLREKAEAAQPRDHDLVGSLVPMAPSIILTLLDRIEAAGDLAALRIHPDATLEGWERMKARIEALEAAHPPSFWTCFTCGARSFEEGGSHREAGCAGSWVRQE